MAKVRALTQVNLIRPRDTEMIAANLPKVLKPAMDWEAMSECTSQLSGVIGEGAYRKKEHRLKGDPAWSSRR